VTNTISCFSARVVVLCFLASTAQLADSTVFVVVRKGNSVWLGANSTLSAPSSNRSFVKVGEDCKIHRKGDLVVLHAGPTAPVSESDSGQFNFVKLILDAENSSLSLEDNQASITAAIERSYEDYGKGLAAWLQTKGKTLPERWVTPLSAQTIVLLKLGTNKKAEAIGVVIAMGMEKDHPHFFLTDIKFPMDGDFSLVYDG